MECKWEGVDAGGAVAAVLSPKPRPPHRGIHYLELRPDNLPFYSHNPPPPSVNQKRLPQNI
eukprot:361974-Chlamydomonas_euryale.AAC.3